MFYLDTSFVAPLILLETTSAKVERFVAALPAGELAISEWTRIEFSSLLGREVRIGGLDGAAAWAADTQLEAIATESFVVLLPEVEDFTLAKRYLGNHAVRLGAGDALHLALAANRRARAIYSLDKTLIKAGRVLGLPVSTGIGVGG
jgi:predicted nucleic acid-binding protein